MLQGERVVYIVAVCFENFVGLFLADCDLGGFCKRILTAFVSGGWEATCGLEGGHFGLLGGCGVVSGNRLLHSGSGNRKDDVARLHHQSETRGETVHWLKTGLFTGLGARFPSSRYESMALPALARLC